MLEVAGVHLARRIWYRDWGCNRFLPRRMCKVVMFCFFELDEVGYNIF